MNRLIEVISPQIIAHLESRKDSMEVMVNGETTSEEWFRIELCAAIYGVNDVKLVHSNRANRSNRERPDFVLAFENHTKMIELKVLPIDKNYSSGWQRFQAGRNNKKDFKNLEDGKRAGVIYIHWPNKVDWQKVKENITNAYRVSCISENNIQVGNNEISLSYWGRKIGS